jgi:glucose-6-phosphate dehydrogenase assembly protein OpcA
MAPALETFTAGAETAVDVAHIERQLRELWQMSAESENGHITRASLFNLIAYTESDADRDHVTEVISTLTSRHPCRAIVLLAKAAEPVDELSASITAHCHLAGGGQKQVCCEQISMYASGRGVGRVAAVVLPLLESDLPAVLWWRGNFLERPDTFRRLSGVSDRVFFDSSAWPAVDLSALARTVVGQWCADFSWTRLGLWRRLVAEAFEECHCRAMLPAIRAVTVEHGRGEGARLRALLLGCWFAAQVGWSPDQTRDRVKLLAREEDDAADVGILSFTLSGEDVEVRVFKKHAEHTATAVVNVANACGLPCTRAFWPKDDASLLSQELDQTAPHQVYQRTLALAAAAFRG